MNAERAFNYDTFISLEGMDLHHYVDALEDAGLANATATSSTNSVYDALLSGLPSMNDEHVVYAIEICMRLNPIDFLPQAVQYLAHNDASVCCAACRAIEQLPQGAIPDSIVSQIEGIPVAPLTVKDIPPGKVITIGTNEVFLRAVLAKARAETKSEPSDFHHLSGGSFR
jgi:hypothetical protein